MQTNLTLKLDTNLIREAKVLAAEGVFGWQDETRAQRTNTNPRS